MIGQSTPIRPFLFDVEAAETSLATRQKLRDYIGAPRELGVESRAFASMRKDDRQLARLLSRPRAGAERLDAIELALSAGFVPAVGLRSRDYEEFSSALTEVVVANDFVRRGFTVTEHNVEGSDPDLAVEQGSIRAIVEIYRPRQWSPSRVFRRAAVDLVEHLDIPVDFRAELTESLERRFIDDVLQHPHPSDTDTALVDQYRWLEELATELERLVPGFTEASFNHVAGNHRMEVRLQEADLDSTAGPIREITTGWSASGWRPERLIEQMVERVARKAARRQAGGMQSSLLRILVVDAEASEVSAELENQHYLDILKENVDGRLAALVGPDGHYDAIAIARPRLSSLRPVVVVHGAEAASTIEAILDTTFSP